MELAAAGGADKKRLLLKLRYKQPSFKRFVWMSGDEIRGVFGRSGLKTGYPHTLKYVSVGSAP